MSSVLLVSCFLWCLLGSCLAFGNVRIELQGTYLKNTTASSAVACASLCDLNANCNGWSWDTCSSPPTRCSLLSKAQTNVLNNCSTSNAKLGEVGVSRTGAYVSGYGPYALTAGSTAANCAALCETVSACVAWNFDNAGRKNCWLLSAIPATTSIVAAQTSGVQGTLNKNSPYFGLNTWILSANATATTCSQLCFATPKCKVWLFQPPTVKCFKNAGMCWAKSIEYGWPSTNECYINGQQPISTAVAPKVNKTTPDDLIKGLPQNVTLPFNKVVAFGDNLSDNGNGSYAHCVTNSDAAEKPVCGNKVYGAGTWTNGQVAVSYLSSYLSMSLIADFAYGHANGGGQFGATIDNSYTQSPALAPSAKDQIANYTNGPAVYRSNIGQTLHFLWIGANDIQIRHIDYNSANNSVFATTFAALMVQRVQELRATGAEYIFLPNLYPKHVAPIFVSQRYIKLSLAQLNNIGLAISQVKAALLQFGNNVIYHDVFSFMLNVYNNPSVYGITHVNGEFCDGYNQLDWELCITDGLGYTFYWIQFLDMTTYVHNLVAADMYKTIINHFAYVFSSMFSIIKILPKTFHLLKYKY